MDAQLLHALVTLARDSIHGALDLAHAALPPELPPALTAPGAAFVTLTTERRLRGCIGTLEAWRPLGEDVCANARAAALSDPRFAPLCTAELATTLVEVSVLQPATPLVFDDEAALLAQLRPGVDGLTVHWNGRRATYLPGVWAQLHDPAQFVATLRRKADIPAGVPVQALVFERYTTLGSPRIPLAPARGVPPPRAAPRR
ncbi:MAG: AmmeMemoRadiSam system protein A [Gammaproteobacteria bacterium]